MNQLAPNSDTNPSHAWPNVALIVPTRNASDTWHDLCDGIGKQHLVPDQIVVIDSSSADDTATQAQNAGFSVFLIDSRDFNHGGTRQLAADLAPDADILVYLTQDAIPCAEDALRILVRAFDDPEIGAAYGRQLPRQNADPIEAHARLFNYPPQSRIRDWESRHTLGFKSIFFSNSFGAFRRAALNCVGGFSRDVIFGEDTLVVAQLHRAGWKTAYVADALVRHSHSLTIVEVLKRYFDIGVLHSRERWLVEQFGSATGEGRRFVLSEMRYLLHHKPVLIPIALAHTLAKYIGYRLGRLERRIAPWLKYNLGMNKTYWFAKRP